MEKNLSSEVRNLRYDFTAVEVYDMSVKLANKTQEHVSVENERKSINSQYKSRLDGIKSDLDSLSNKVASGYEMRKVECTIQYHFPEQNKKTVIRRDTGEKMVEKMNVEDHNLWNQFEENPTNNEFGENIPVNGDTPVKTEEGEAVVMQVDGQKLLPKPKRIRDRKKKAVTDKPEEKKTNTKGKPKK